ncbi:unnamed protein product [Caenorhabditis auriculariae]|uniref:Uncharacterized protein n=1 Tax=Caenorhabditis auriculariae TaxID=2777116 RepID=A0A8S1GZ72_9PELO|nr:unnamed protein product [Caenorhabditis auriculariae]
MSLGRAIYARVLRLVHTVVGLFRRVLRCDRNNGPKMDFDDDNFDVVVQDSRVPNTEERASLIENAHHDSWDDNEWDKREEIQDKIEQWRSTQVKKEAPKVEEDLFSTLEPTITHARKVVVKPRVPQHNAPKRNLFEFNEASMVRFIIGETYMQIRVNR